METNRRVSSTKECCHETLPSLVKFITAIEVANFDSVKGQNDLNNQREPTQFHSFGPSLSGFKSANTERTHSVSISMPPSPMGVRLPNTKRVFFRDYHEDDKRFDSFRTLSGRLERQLSNLRGKNRNNTDESDHDAQPQAEIGNLPVDRYFDALEGPELDTLRDSEKILLPEDKKWPFLLRYPVTSFGICLGVSSQAILWKTLATSDSTKFLRVSLDVNLVLWCISIALIAIVGLIYALKMVFYFEAVRREYFHPIRVNFFFAPWITLLLLAIGAPPSVAQNLHEALWYVLMTPILFLELKIYGQWISGGQRRLSKVANPSNHLSIIGNFVGALLGASMGLKEGPVFFFAVGLAHYIVLFVTLYQRLPTNETLPKELHPVFFLFVAVPSAASMAWTSINGSFDYGSRIAYFVALFLYFSLAVRINFFRGFRFSLAWWAYTFPTTGVAIATVIYSNAITHPLANCLAMMLTAVATLAVTALLTTTIFHAFVLQDLFPNDMAIAITTEAIPHKTIEKSSKDEQDTRYCIEYLDLGAKDVAPSLTPSSKNDPGEYCTSDKKDFHIDINT